MRQDKPQQRSLEEVNKICLYGASGHAKVIAEIASKLGRQIDCFFDDNEAIKSLISIDVLSPDLLHEYSKGRDFLVSIGNNQIRKKISNQLKVSYATLIDSNALVSTSVKVGEGSVIMTGAIINTESKIGKHCIINTGAIIEHECVVEDYVHVSPGATVTGNVRIGEGTHIGANAVVIPNITIGKWVTIGAGAVVLNDVPDHAVVVGNPGRIVKYNN